MPWSSTGRRRRPAQSIHLHPHLSTVPVDSSGATATIDPASSSLQLQLHMEALLPSSISPKISTILQSHVYPRFGRVLRALVRAKSVLLDALGKTKWGARRQRQRQRWRGKQQQHAAISCGRSKKSKRSGRQQQATAATNSGGGGGGGYTRSWKPPHLTWSGGQSPARTAAAEVTMDVKYHVYSCYESAWNAVVVPVPVVASSGGSEGGTTVAAGEYCGYLRWLEEEEMPDDQVVVVEEDDDEGEGEEDADGAGGNEIDWLAEQFIARCRANFLLEKQESYDRCQEMIARGL